MRRLVLASGNAGKLREFRALLAPLEVQVISQAELAIEPAAEPHPTFVENALAKARHAAAASGLPALADDSGLTCPALDGAPGVRSARFAGDDTTDGQNNAALLQRLAGAADRSGHYTCVLVALRAPDDPEPIIAEARWYGQIVDAPRGAHGFGYDPHFFLPELGLTAAELHSDQKNRISHRGQAMADLARKLAVHWGW
ncbi:MAG: RdgB/HAM1 family non-canonical purine NTP pyrophosphatase [Burkholderiaceae bacterium]|jgi:XTP/dITP diphosphohydrolase|nr:RdgB/HAM1 family non-canonical purine NTP pyrophosphatase [Burkholderiaceae bacterium]